MDNIVNNLNQPFVLVLCGGGAKGAYQIGVWEYLKARGLDRQISAVSGASVGALNTLLIAQGDLELAKKVWREATPDMIVKQDRLQALIERSIHTWERIINGPVPLFACISDITGLPSFSKKRLAKPDYIRLNDLPKEDCIRTVLASGAVPVIVPPHKIDGKTYVDGGISDNMPVRPLVSLGLKNILIVHLDPDGPVEDFFFSNATQGLDVSDIVFHHIYPRRSHTPVDFFSLYAQHSHELMQDGYRDACAVINSNRPRMVYRGSGGQVGFTHKLSGNRGHRQVSCVL